MDEFVRTIPQSELPLYEAVVAEMLERNGGEVTIAIVKVVPANQADMVDLHISYRHALDIMALGFNVARAQLKGGLNG
jgi:hypothetical protein